MRSFLRDLCVAAMLLALAACTAPSPVIPTQPAPSADAGLLTPAVVAEQTVSTTTRVATTATPIPARSPVSAMAKARANALEPTDQPLAQAPASVPEPTAQLLTQPVVQMTATQYLDIAPNGDHAEYALIGRTLITSTASTAVPTDAPFPAAALVDLSRCAATDACIAKDEALTLAGGVPGVERVGEQLRIHHSSGSTSVFTHQRGRGGGGWATYRYLGYVPELTQHLLRVSYYEGGDYMLVAAKDGATTMLWTVPTLAPDGQRMAAVGALPFSGGSPLRIQVWQVESTSLAPWHSLDIFGMSNFAASYRTVTEWIDADTLAIRAVDSQDGSDSGLGVITVEIEPDGLVAYLDGVLIPQPILDGSWEMSEGYADETLSTPTVGGRVYRDRDYRFLEVPDVLDGAAQFLFSNSSMETTTQSYLRFRLYRPATLYVAIDAEASALPGWLSDGWEPIDEAIVTDDDIPMRLYKKAFEPGEVTLGANWMPPASGVRSHYLLFVK